MALIQNILGASGLKSKGTPLSINGKVFVYLRRKIVSMVGMQHILALALLQGSQEQWANAHLSTHHRFPDFSNLN